MQSQSTDLFNLLSNATEAVNRHARESLEENNDIKIKDSIAKAQAEFVKSFNTVPFNQINNENHE